MKLDPSTLSNYTRVSLKSTSLKLRVNWTARVLHGSVRYSFDEIHDRQVVLDTSHLKVHSVHFNNEPVKFILGPREEPLGSTLSVTIPTDNTGTLDIQFETTELCTALQWLHPEQTSGKTAPYLFSQCEPIHARSLFPCFDSPGIKSVFDIEVISDYAVVATGNVVSTDSSTKTYRFRQDIPIPSYLFAIASGNLVSAPIGPRSLVWSEPEDLAACKYEFEADTEKFIEVAEKLVFPYEWKTYNVVVLPPSFPFGGMENPNITFATPTLISGDRQLIEVIAHELAHSWSGNLVTNASWEHFWLNEGWTVYLERRILGALNGESYRHFEAIIGWKDLEDSIKAMGTLADNFSRLIVDLKDKVDPDDAFSTVPYEKGSTFLMYLENLLGRDNWDRFIPFYFGKFKGKSLDSFMFKDTLYEFFTDKHDLLDGVDWHTWFNVPGLPPKPKFDTAVADPCYRLAAQYEASASGNGDFSWASAKDIDGWRGRQLLVFLDSLIARLQGSKFSAEAAKRANELYEFSTSKNSEIKSRWFKLAVMGRIEFEYRSLADWLGTIGRMKFVRPGYRQLDQVDRDLALSTFESNRGFYHPICRALVVKDLGL